MSEFQLLHEAGLSKGESWVGRFCSEVAKPYPNVRMPQKHWNAAASSHEFPEFINRNNCSNTSSVKDSLILTEVPMSNPHPQGSASNGKARIGLGWDLTSPASGGCEGAVWVGVPTLVSFFFAGVSYPTIFLYTIELKIIGVTPVIGSPESKIISRLLVRLPLLSLLA